MQNKSQIAGKHMRRTLSLLLSLVMVVTALPLLPFNAAAAADYAAINAALQAVHNQGITSFASTIIDQRRFNNHEPSAEGGAVYDRTHHAEGDHAAYGTFQSGGAWAVSTAGATVYDLLPVYAQAMNHYRDNMVNETITGSGTYQGQARRSFRGAGFGNRPAASNYTAPLITGSILGNVNDPAGVLQWLSGNQLYRLPSGNGTQATEFNWDLLDQPRTMTNFRRYTAVMFSAGWWADWHGWREGYKSVPGGLTVLRTPQEALADISDNLNNFGPTVSLTTAREIYHFHSVDTSPMWTGPQPSLPLFGTADQFRYHFAWHVLRDPVMVADGTAILNPIIRENLHWATTPPLNTATLRLWRDLPCVTDSRRLLGWRTESELAAMPYADLYALYQAYHRAYNAMAAATFPTAILNQGASSLLTMPATDYVLEHFNLPPIMNVDTWGSGVFARAEPLPDLGGYRTGMEYIAMIEEFMIAALADDFAKYFHYPASGKLVTPESNRFMYQESISWSPAANNNLYYGFTLRELEALYAEGLQRNNFLRHIEDTNQPIWIRVEQRCAELGFQVNTGATAAGVEGQATYLDNLRRMINIWKIYEIRDWVVDLLGDTEYIHEGRNENIPGWEPNPAWQPDPNDPEDPGGIFGNSRYRIGNTLLNHYLGTGRAYQTLLNSLWSNPANGFEFQGLINEILLSDFDYNGYSRVWDRLNERMVIMDNEFFYRSGNWWGPNSSGSEDFWYSYRDFFLPLLFADLSSMSGERMMDLLLSDEPFPLPYPEADPNMPRIMYRGMEPNRAQYIFMHNNAAAALETRFPGEGAALAETIYGGDFLANVIDPAIDRVFMFLAAELTQQVYDTMQLILGAKDGGAINITTTYQGSTITVFDWATFSLIGRAITRFRHGDARLGIYTLLEERTRLHMLGSADGTYSAAQTEYDYLFLINTVWNLYQSFLNNPGHQQTRLWPPARNAMPGDILPGHQYADVGVAGGRQAGYWGIPGIADDPFLYNHIGVPQVPRGHFYTNADDAAMNTLIERADFIIGEGGNFLPLLQMAGLDEMLAGLGLQIGDDMNLRSLLESLLADALFTDEMMNMLVGMLFPMILNMLEDVFVTEMLPELHDVEAGLPNMSLGSNSNQVWIGDSLWGLTDLQSNSFSLIRVYPDQFARSIDRTQFPHAHAQLSRADRSPEGHIWRRGPNGNYIWNQGSGAAANLGAAGRGQNMARAALAYPTRAWDPDKSPTLYRPHPETGEPQFWVNWFIDTYPHGGERSPAARQDRFTRALADVFGAAWPIFNALLLGNTVVLHRNTAARARVPVALDFGGTGSVIPIHLDLRVAGMPGVSQILTPIFELLLGEEINSIPDIQTLQQIGRLNGNVQDFPTNAQIRTMSTNLVNAILTPVFEYFDRLAERPITEVLKLLPNIAYALSFDRIAPLLEEFEVRLDIEVDLGGLMGAIGGAFVDLTIPPMIINVSEMLEDLDLESLLNPDELMNMLLGALGDDIALPPPNWGLFASLGEMLNTYPISAPTLTSRRWNPGNNPNMTRHPGNAAGDRGRISNVGDPHRLFIRANRPDVMQALLKYLLGAIPSLLPALGLDLGDLPILTGSLDEQVAALLELILPREYDVTEVTFTEPGNPPEIPYPAWWAGRYPMEPDGVRKAELDGQYLVANADTLVNILWSLLHPNGVLMDDGVTMRDKTFGDSVRDMISTMFDSAMMITLSETIQGLVLSMTEEFLADFDLIDMVEMLIRIDGQQLNLSAFLEYPLGTLERRPQLSDPEFNNNEALFQQALNAYLARVMRPQPDDPRFGGSASAYQEALEAYETRVAAYFAGRIESVDDFFDELIKFLEPISQLLDILLEGKTLELIHMGDNTGLLRVLGNNGKDALAHLIGAFTKPLGITYDPGPQPPAGTPEHARWLRRTSSLGNILFPLVDVLDEIIDRPVGSLLKLLPNLVHFVTAPAGSDSPLQQALDAFLHPLYVLIDTLRPLVDINPVLAMLGLDAPMELFPGVTLCGNRGLRIDAIGLLDSFLGDLGINISNYMIGSLCSNATCPSKVNGRCTNAMCPDQGTHLIANQAGVLFMLLDDLGLLFMIQDMGMIGLTKLIQYDRFPEQVPVD